MALKLAAPAPQHYCCYLEVEFITEVEYLVGVSGVP